ncbi:MAG: response regulator [Oligoflexales bacterium]
MVKSKVLMVDDEADLLSINKDYFEQEGFEVSTAEDGFEALALISEEKFDAIITDYTMPRMNGIQFANYVKVNENNAQTPIFVISGNINDNAMDKLKEIGVIGFISKPYDIQKVINTVKAKIFKKSRTDSYSDEIVSTFSKSVSEVFSHYFPEKVNIADSKIFSA